MDSFYPLPPRHHNNRPHPAAVDSDGEVSRLPAKVEHDFAEIGQRTMLINANRVVRLESSTSKELLHRAHDGCIPVLASRCGGSFNPEATPTAQHADTVAVGSGLNDLKTASAIASMHPRTTCSWRSTKQ